MKREVKIGLFAVIILCCTWAGIRFLSGIDIFSRNVDYYATYERVDGVGAASAVIINGVKVGSVTEVIFDPEVSSDVTLKLSIKRQYQIPKDSKAKIYSPGLMSSMAVGIVMGTSAEPLESGAAIDTYLELGLMDSASGQLSDVVEHFGTIAEKLSVTLDEVNSLLVENNSNINGTIAQLNGITSKINTLLAKQSENIGSAVENLSSLAESLESNSDHIVGIVENLDQVSADIKDANIAENLGATIQELNTALTKINGNKGTAGKLLSDEELYDNLASLSSSLDTLIQDMQTNPKRYVHFSLF